MNLKPATRAALIAATLLLSLPLAGWAMATMHAGAQPAASASPAIATVDALRLVQALLESDDYLAERTEAEERLTGELQAAQDELTSLQEEIQLLPPADPRGNTLRQEFQQRLANLQQMSQTAQAEVSQLLGEQAARAYERIADASREVATKRGYTHLISTRRDREIPAIGGLSAVTQEILARTVLLAPGDTDITDAVRTKLDLPEFTEDAPAGLMGPQDAAGGAGG